MEQYNRLLISTTLSWWGRGLRGMREWCPGATQSGSLPAASLPRALAAFSIHTLYRGNRGW